MKKIVYRGQTVLLSETSTDPYALFNTRRKWYRFWKPKYYWVQRSRGTTLKDLDDDTNNLG